MRAPAPGARILRRASTSVVFAAIRAERVVTISDLMAATRLTRSTTIAACEDLLAGGWIRELENQRAAGDYRRGRPARRFTLDEGAGCVIGMDVGPRRLTIVIADLRGTARGRISRTFEARELSPQQRLAIIEHSVLSALQAAHMAPSTVLAVTIGLPAPADRPGNEGAVQDFVDLGECLEDALSTLAGCVVVLENDANLAAIAERWRGSAVGVDDVTLLLVEENFSAGIVAAGRLLSGRTAAAGRMGHLRIVEGVGSTEGLATMARSWAMNALAEGQVSQLRTASDTGRAITLRHVFAAAALGDDLASSIVDRLAERLARVICTVASLLNSKLVVIAGVRADSVSALLDPTAQKLTEHMPAPPRLAASSLDGIVSIGAVRHALDRVEASFFGLNVREG